MSRTGPRARSRLSVQEKTQVVLAVLGGEMTLAEATVQLRIWRMGAEHIDAVPSQTSKR